jgi:23S rRNA (guanosine2251-2'-O)-methyltransferase
MTTNKNDNNENLEDRDIKKEGIIIGRNEVSEALKSGRSINCIYVQRGLSSGPIVPLIAKARKLGIPIKEADTKKLDYMCGDNNHQGIIASCSVKEYSSIEDIFNLAEQRGEAPLIIICDELDDPHNLGAIIRTAECVGAHGVIIPKRRSVGLTYAVGKSSAGAVEYVPVVRVTNISSTIDDLKKRNVWIYAAESGGTDWYKADFRGPMALVIGSEGKGISRLVKEKSDFIVSLPLKGKINSLNASVACGIISYEILRQRS